ncbi:GID complex subunit 4, VID24 [Nowakowskiella sp. JEL0407]|nr:GID complex subunit 4, VID24 [Nowakowskiella sp. JEL0407]
MPTANQLQPILEDNPKLKTPIPSPHSDECTALFSGQSFKGVQKSGRNCYDVFVNLKYVDLEDSFLCGYLYIKGLTEDFPELCTFFEGEIIGPKHSFLTRKWNSDASIDREHWVKLTDREMFYAHINF